MAAVRAKVSGGAAAEQLKYELGSAHRSTLSALCKYP